MNHPLIGKVVVVMCSNYIYCGVLSEISPSHVVLDDPEIVYDTGEWSAKTWTTSEKLPTDKHYLERGAVEGMFELKR